MISMQNLTQHTPLHLSLYPSCLQITMASFTIHPSSDTVPQIPLIHTSTRPSNEFGPPISLKFPLAQPGNNITIVYRLFGFKH